MAEEVKVIDATGLVLGRASSLIAKRLLQGESLVVVNAEKAVVIGGRDSVLANYSAMMARGSSRKGPHYPRGADRLFRRTVRGMLPVKRSTGRDAFKRFMTYVGVPKEFEGKPMEVLESAKPSPSLKDPLTLVEISRLMGAKV